VPKLKKTISTFGCVAAFLLLPAVLLHCLAVLSPAADAFEEKPVSAPAQEATASPFKGLDNEITSDMKALHVPGAAVGVVVDGKTVFAKGYGLRELGKQEPVDADTIFAVGSISKSFTTSAMAILADEGKLDWDKTVREYLPWFQMYDPVSTQLVTLRDLVTHRTGMARHDFLRHSTYQSPSELVHHVRYLEPSHTFRETFEYNNIMLAVAGFLAGEQNGTSWETLVSQKVFLPLGMTRTTASVDDTQKLENYASPHDLEGTELRKISFYNYQKFGVAPAGAINSSVNDLLKYLQMHLAEGSYQNKQIISTKQTKELHTPVIMVPPSDKEFSDYALGWFVTDHRGATVINHSGSINGFTAMAIIIPEKKAAIIVLNNLESSSLPKAVGWSIADRILELNRVDYLAQYISNKQKDKLEDAKAKATVLAGRVPGTRTSLELPSYCGTYFHPAYGTIKVIPGTNGTGLSIVFDAKRIDLEHYHFDTFVSNSEDLDGELVQFELDSSGKVARMLIPLQSSVKPFVFLKR
jgi:CubicO group peptidase (beta-lactamase class C family)